MAKFVYRMQNILNLKENLEKQQKAAFTVANNRLMKEQDKLQELMLRQASYENELDRMLKGVLNLKEIARCRNSIEAMKSLVRDQMIVVHQAQKKVDEERKKLDEIMKDRKTHEKLKEKAFDEFKEELNHQEMKEIDELVSFTHSKA